MNACISETSATDIPKTRTLDASVLDYRIIYQSLGDTDSSAIPEHFKYYQSARYDQWIRDWVKRLHLVAAENTLWWQKPLVNISINAEIVLEWWYKSKKLTFYISPDNKVDFVKVWGPDIHTQMEDGSLKSKSELISILNWIAD